MNHNKVLLALGVLLSAGNVTAATVVESRDATGGTSTMTVEGTRARVQMSPQRYILIDAGKEHYYAIDDSQQLVLDMARIPQGVSDVPAEERRQGKVEADLRHIGPGPRIAGYPTEHYRLYANGELCQDSYLSRPALEQAGMAEFLEAFQRFTERQRAQYRALGAPAEPCEEAEQAAARRHPRLGMPMKIVSDGQLRQEVLNIRTDVEVAADRLELPQGYRLSDPQSEMQRSQEAIDLRELEGDGEHGPAAASRRGREMLRRQQ